MMTDRGWCICICAPFTLARHALLATRPRTTENLRYALTVFDVASRIKKFKPLTSKTAAEVADGLARIYKRSPLQWPKLLQVSSVRELMGTVSQLLAKQSVQVQRVRVDIHRDQGIVERWNRTLAERLFGHQYAKEMRGGRVVRWSWVNFQYRGVLQFR